MSSQTNSEKNYKYYNNTMLCSCFFLKLVLQNITGIIEFISSHPPFIEGYVRFTIDLLNFK